MINQGNPVVSAGSSCEPAVPYIVLHSPVIRSSADQENATGLSKSDPANFQEIHVRIQSWNTETAIEAIEDVDQDQDVKLVCVSPLIEMEKESSCHCLKIMK